MIVIIVWIISRSVVTVFMVDFFLAGASPLTIYGIMVNIYYPEDRAAAGSTVRASTRHVKRCPAESDLAGKER
jgi:hypothetical protein